MARPKKEEGVNTAKESIEQAFWELIKTYPIDKMSIGMITEKAGCNRGTFYYYYEDIYHMVEQLIDENFPEEVPAFLVSRFNLLTEMSSFEALITRNAQKFDNLCYLLNGDSSMFVSKHIKEVLLHNISEAFSINIAELPRDTRVIFECATSAILGMLAFRAANGIEVPLTEYVKALAPEIPFAFIFKMRKSLKSLNLA